MNKGLRDYTRPGQRTKIYFSNLICDSELKIASKVKNQRG